MGRRNIIFRSDIAPKTGANDFVAKAILGRKDRSDHCVKKIKLAKDNGNEYLNQAYNRRIHNYPAWLLKGIEEAGTWPVSGNRV